LKGLARLIINEECLIHVLIRHVYKQGELNPSLSNNNNLACELAIVAMHYSHPQTNTN
jgi:hypothetical protein